LIPLRDNIPASRRPVVTYAFVAISAAVFALQLADPGGDMVYGLGMIPDRVLEGDQVREAAWVPEWLTLVTCTFLHGGWMHFLGNMLFLWIFGDNVEDRLGRLGFVAFYLGCGVAASASHLAISPDSPVPTIGASGSIAGVMGAYMLLYPRAKVQVLIIFYFVDIIVLPAMYFLGFWFLLQFLQGASSLGMSQRGGGVAFWAHIGGFVAGVVVVLGLKVSKKLRPALPPIALSRSRRFGGGRSRWQ
jgi:membrane associated rhomboid family serine protease